MKVAVLGWGSLIWDQDTEKGKEFDHWRKSKWEVVRDLKLPIEFSRISKSRKGALTLVIDEDNGRECYVRLTSSRRKYFEDAVCDLKRREGTHWGNIGYWSARGDCSGHKLADCIGSWGAKRGFDAVVWTALESNFQECAKKSFTIENAIRHLKGLSPIGQLEAKEYIWRAPDEVRTKLRVELETDSWMKSSRA